MVAADARMWAASPADAPWVEYALKQAFEPYRAALNALRGPTDASPLDWVPQRIEAGDIWLFGDGSGAVGAVVVALDGSDLKMERLAVLPAHQCQGWGQYALAKIEREARAYGCRAIRLFTAQPMTRLITLYSAAGYMVTAVGANPSRDDGVPRVFMEKPLTSQEGHPA